MATRIYDLGDLLPGGYRVLDVRQGGMGVVYICHQSDTDELYAIKTVRMDGRARDVDARLQLFGKEVRTWIHISNNTTNLHLVRALTFNSDHRMLCLEFINGLPLNRVVEKGRTVHASHALQWARDIACGMEELHSRYRVVHRDLKPQNVLIHGETERLTAKITDFGITRELADRGDSPTRIGTPAYMAPEVHRGVDADFRSDIYSYGATLSWMVTGAPAFDPARAGSVRGPFGALIQRCLEQEPDDRIQSFGEIRSILDGIDSDSSLGSVSHYHFCKLHQYLSPVEPQALSKSRHSPCLFCIQSTDLMRRESGIVPYSSLGPMHPGHPDDPVLQSDPTAPTLSSRDSTEMTLALGAESEPRIAGHRWRWLIVVCALLVTVLVALPGSAWRWLAEPIGGTAVLLPGPVPGCVLEGCEQDALPKDSNGAFAGDARYCADHAMYECPLCLRTFHSTDLDFEGKCECGGALAPRPGH
ncbi:MAG: serine/threonine protein kinase [Chlamydiales bacterium]